MALSKSEQFLRNIVQTNLAAGAISNALANQILSYYRELRKLLGRSDYDAALRDLQRQLRDGLTEVLVAELQLVGQAAVASSAAFLGTQPTRVSKLQVTRAMSMPLEAQNTTINGMFSGLLNGIVDRGRSVLAQVYNDSLTLRQAQKAILDNSVVDRRQVEAFTRTAVTSVSNTVRNQYYQDTGEVDRVIWAATLDHRTSAYCSLMDGKVFPVNKGPRPPAHVNCRSTVLPVQPGQNATTIKQQIERPKVVPTSDYEKGDTTVTAKRAKTPSGAPRTRVAKPSRQAGSPLRGGAAQGQNYEGYLRSVAKQENGRQFVRDILGVKAGNQFLKGASLRSVLKGQAGAEEALRDIRRSAI